MMNNTYKVVFPDYRKHPDQNEFVECDAKRIIIRAGRRGGKTVGAGARAARSFLKKRRILYAAPTADQTERFWVTVMKIFQDPIDRKILYKNESERVLEVPGTEIRIKAKTAWNADTLRGDYADDLILDEWQLTNEEAWGLVGAPMLLDNNGNATFIYTPPSLHSRSTSKAHDPQHASKLFKKAQEEEALALKENRPSRWKTFHFSSDKNPFLSREALGDITKDMTNLAYRMEVLAEDVNEAPGALWTRETIEKNRVMKVDTDYDRLVVAIDPSATSEGDEAGIVAAGKIGDHGYIIADVSIQGSPLTWAQKAIDLYRSLGANCIVAESNQGGEMISTIISGIDPQIMVSLVHASRGKQTRAEPIAAKYEQGFVHHVNSLPALEDEMCLWIPGDKSPNRMDALVWACAELKLEGKSGTSFAAFMGE
jgi:hypothetical protein